MNRSAGCPMAAGVSYPGARFLKRPSHPFDRMDP